MDTYTRIALALGAAGLVFLYGVVTMGSAKVFGLFLALLVLAYAYGPSVVEGVPE